MNKAHWGFANRKQRKDKTYPDGWHVREYMYGHQVFKGVDVQRDFRRTLFDDTEQAANAYRDEMVNLERQRDRFLMGGVSNG